MLTRREFLKKTLAVCAAGLCAQTAGKLINAEALSSLGYSKEAYYYKKLDAGTVMCLLCPHKCILREGQRSLCKVREPKGGKLYSLVYELPCSVHVDPIEKKPIYHMFPASKSFSIATAGCNLRCKFCQNWQISQEYPEDTFNRYLSCEKAVDLAIKYKCRSIAYTYSEPTVFYEYMRDTAREARSRGIKNIYVTGGYINQEPLHSLCEVIDAANIDLKGFDDAYLREICNERLEPLLATIKTAKKKGVWVEITNLIIPTLNDDLGMIREMCVWIKENIGAETPLHFSRFWPMYKLKNLPPTSLRTLRQAKNIATQSGLDFVYIGNVPEEKESNTYCPHCKKLLIKRRGYIVTDNHIVNSQCQYCNCKIPGMWG